MIIKRNQCIFCEDGKSFKSREHAFPSWLLNELKIKAHVQPFFGTQYKKIEDFHVESESEVFKRFNLDNFRSPYVCDDCNQGWMASLESKIKPILLPLIHGQKSLTDIKESERLLIARWAVKTTCVLESITFGNPNYLSFDTKIVRDIETLPSGWAVYGCTHEATSLVGYITNNVWYVEGDLSPEIRKKLDRFKKTVFQMKDLIIATAFLGSEDLVLNAVESLHFPLSINLTYKWVQYPSAPSFTTFRNVPPNSSDDIMFRFLGALSLGVEGDAPIG